MSLHILLTHLENTPNSKANMKVYQSLEAYDMFQDKHVQDCFVFSECKPNATIYIPIKWLVHID